MAADLRDLRDGADRAGIGMMFEILIATSSATERQYRSADPEGCSAKASLATLTPLGSCNRMEAPRRFWSFRWLAGHYLAERRLTCEKRRSRYAAEPVPVEKQHFDLVFSGELRSTRRSVLRLGHGRDCLAGDEARCRRAVIQSSE